jgi:SAM-dependent methyltransferase
MKAVPGSFRDRNNRVYDNGKTIIRGISRQALNHWNDLAGTSFFKSLSAEKKVIGTKLAAPENIPDGWPAALIHDRVPFVSYPYEWPFGMLKDAAILHLDILERAYSHGWILKDSSSYNIQWMGSQPVFIDIPSFEPYKKGEPWTGYRQFCMMFLIPLMLQAYKNIDYRNLLRSNLEGIDPALANQIISGFSRFRRGVFSNVYLHSKFQARSARQELNEAKKLTEDSGREVQKTKNVNHSDAMILGTIQGLSRLVKKLKLPNFQTSWGSYEVDHSYSETSLSAKEKFVDKYAGSKRRALVWDLGCNTGNFSRICSRHSDYVISLDGDFNAIERLYRREKKKSDSNILPLVMNLSNISPNQGWRGRERMSLEERGRPDLVVCLALIHHMVISANIPLAEYIEWLHSLGAEVIIEFVGISDSMSQILIRNRVNQYEDLTHENFEKVISQFFVVNDSELLKGGDRKIYYLSPL